MKRLWDVPGDVRTVHLCACTPEEAAAIAAALDDAGIVYWVKPAPAGFLAFLQRESQVFVDRARVDDATAVARRALGGEEPR
jgi:hypothetical protein